MRRKYTPKEITTELKKLCVVGDTREKSDEHIKSYLAKNGISFDTKTFDTADYTLRYADLYFDDEVMIERKGSIDEIAGNFTKERDRFEREFIRAKARGIKMFLLVEDCSWEEIRAHNYRSELRPKALLGSLCQWQARYGVTIIFCPKELSGMLIHSTLYYWLKERLENGG